MFLLILSSHRLGTTGKKPLCCVEEMHIFKASPSNSIRYKPVNFHVTHSSFQVYIAKLLLNLKGKFFEPAVGLPPNFARMCRYRPY